jgi:hypothetical protein
MYKADVVKFFGSVQRAAIALDRNRSTFHLMSDPLPKGVACEVEVVTCGGMRVDWTLYPRKHAIPEQMPKAYKPRGSA